jgi:hypothetical protein
MLDLGTFPRRESVPAQALEDGEAIEEDENSP